MTDFPFLSLLLPSLFLSAFPNTAILNYAGEARPFATVGSVEREMLLRLDHQLHHI